MLENQTMMIIILYAQIKYDFFNLFLASQQLHLQQYNITLQSQMTIFDLGLKSMFNFRIDSCTKECFSLTLLTWNPLSQV